MPDANPDKAFERYVWTDPGVCNNCFRRCKEIHEAEREVGIAVETVQESYRTPEGELAQDSFEQDEYGAIQTHEPRTTCSTCGSIGLLCQRDTYSKAEVGELAERIANRLIENDVPCHVDATRRLAVKAKAKCNIQGKDREIFEGAAAFGIRQARNRPSSA